MQPNLLYVLLQIRFRLPIRLAVPALGREVLQVGFQIIIIMLEKTFVLDRLCHRLRQFIVAPHLQLMARPAELQVKRADVRNLSRVRRIVGTHEDLKSRWENKVVREHARLNPQWPKPSHPAESRLFRFIANCQSFLGRRTSHTMVWECTLLSLHPEYMDNDCRRSRQSSTQQQFQARIRPPT